MSNKYYDVLWVDKKSTQEEIKKAYRKKAMEFHPDRAKWDKKVAEAKFKEVWEAYDTLSDTTKRKNYDMFGSWKSNPFWWGSSYSSWWSWGFEDMFSWFWWWTWAWWNNWGFEFNMEDLFGWWSRRKQPEYKQEKEKKEETLDFEKIYELPIFDFILGWKLEVKWVYGQNSTIKIPAWTRPGVKMRVKWFWKKEWWKIWNLLVKINAKMPKYISDMDKQMLERISDGIGY